MMKQSGFLTRFFNALPCHCLVLVDGLFGVPVCGSGPGGRTQGRQTAGRAVRGYTLRSNGAEMEAIVKASNITGHKQMNAPFFGTWHGFVRGGKDGIMPKAQEILRKGDIPFALARRALRTLRPPAP